MMIALSIIVPVYNVEKYLSKCIDSILNQTFSNYELILIDDGSTDNSGSICDRYAKLDTRIKVIHQNNKGLSCARNVGIDIAKGKYIGFVDSDDWIEPKMYETLLKNIIKSEADISVCGKQEVNDDGEAISHKLIRGKGDIVVDRNEAFELLFSKNDCIFAYAWNKLYKRELFSSLRYPEGKTFEDVYVIADILLRAKAIHITYKPLYNYLRRKDSITGSAYNKSKWDSIASAQRLYECIEKEYPEYKKRFRRYYCEKCFMVLESILASNSNDILSRNKLISMIKEEAIFILLDNELTVKRKLATICLAVDYRLFYLCMKFK